MKKNVIFSILLSVVLISNLSADDLIFRDIQQKLDKKKINDVELTKVLETPSLFKNSTIRFESKFSQIGNLSRVFHTKYDLSEYLNFAVWPDEVKLWQKDGLKVFLPLIFVKKSSNNATVISKLKKYQRVQITGLVTNDYQNQPWIEVLAVKVLDKNALSEEALYYIRLGDKYHYGDHPVESGAEKSIQANIGINLSHAEIEYQKALTYELSDVEKSAVLELLGDVQLKQSKLTEAIASLTASLDINPDSGRSNHLMALTLLAAGNYDQAKIFGEKALDALSKDKDVLLCNAAILIKLKNYEMAKTHCINANRLDADDIRPYALLGEIYDALNEFDVSKEMYRRAINLKDGVDNFDLHKNMGHALLKIALVEKNAKEKESALMQADRELNATINQINDKNPEAFYLWGRVLEEWKSRPKSEIDSIDKFDKAIALQPDYFNAHMHKANVLNYRMNKPKDAIVSYEKASSIKPTDLNPLKALEKIYREAKSFDKTVSVNTRIVVIEPKNFGATYAIGMDNHMHLNLQAEAVIWFTKALVLDLNHTEVEFYLGKSLYLSGKKSESIKPLLNASVKLPKEKLVYYFLAKAYADTDQSAKAIEMLVKYNSMDQENVETRILLSNEYLRNAKTIDLAVKTAVEAVALAEKQKSMVGASLDAHGWALANHNQASTALPLLEKANKDQVTNNRQYHLSFVYVQLNMFSEAEETLKKLESSELDKKLASDVKKLRADLNNRVNKDLDMKKKLSAGSGEKESQPEKKPEPVKKTEPEKKKEPEKAKVVEKKKEPEKVNESEKKKSDEAAAKEAAKEAEKTRKLEEKKLIDREKAKKEENERLAKIEEEKERERAAAAKEEAERKRKADEAKAKEEKKLAAQKSEDDAKKKKAEVQSSKTASESKKEEEKKQKELAKEKAAQDKKAKEEAKASEVAKAKAKEKEEETKRNQEKEAKAASEKLAKENAEKDKKAKVAAEKKAKEDEKLKAEETKKAKVLADKAKKEEADRNKAALLKEKEENDKKEKAAKDEAKKAEADKKKKAEADKAKQAELEKQKEAERAAILKEAEEKKKLAEKASKERAKATEEAEKLERQRKKEAEKNSNK